MFDIIADMPFAASNPHFYGRYPNELTQKLDGFNPDKDRHQSFIIVEPVMGVPIDQSARSQNNVIIPELHGFNDEIQRFSDMALPTFWVEYVSILRRFKSVNESSYCNEHKIEKKNNYFHTFQQNQYKKTTTASEVAHTTNRKSSLFHIVRIAISSVCNNGPFADIRRDLSNDWSATLYGQSIERKRCTPNQWIIKI